MLCSFKQDDRSFESNGDHIIKATSAVVRKEDNGEYFVTIEAPLSEAQWLSADRIVAVDTPWGRQGFRVKNPKIKSSRIRVKAKHIYYDSETIGIVDSNIVGKNGSAALVHLNTHTETTSPFQVASDVGTIANARIVRKSLREAIEGFVVPRWGGHLVRDNWTIKLMANIGVDNGVVISYGKNLKGITVDENWDDVVTKIYPVGRDGFMLPELFLESDVQYDVQYTRFISFSQDVSEDDYEDETKYREALEEDLRSQATEYLNQHKVPQVSYTTDSAKIEKITDVGDTVRVKHPKIPVDILTTITALEWDAIDKKYTSVSFGTIPTKTLSGLTRAIKESQQKQEEEQEQSREWFYQALEAATNLICGGLGGNVILGRNAETGKPEEILIMDTDDKKTCKYCIRMNMAGIGYSKKGYLGPFDSAWTMDGEFDASVINVIHLRGESLTIGKIKDAAKLNYWNLETGEFALASGTTIGGKTVSEIASGAVSDYDNLLNQTKVFNKLTNNGEEQAIYMQDRKLYINASYIQAGTISADRLAAGIPSTKLAQAVQDSLSNADKAAEREVAQRGTSTTAAGTAAKTATSAHFVLETGATIAVRFANANTKADAALTLKVGTTDAKPIWVGSGTTSATNQLIWAAGATLTFQYDGTYWVLIDAPGDYYCSACSAAAGTAAKTSAAEHIVIRRGTTVSVPMTNENTSGSATLNISSTGAKGIRYGTGTDVPTTANGRGWIAGRTATFKFDGSAWRIIDNATIIDGGHIKTGTIDASVVNVTNINADNIKSGSISASRITSGTMSANRISGGTIDANNVTINNLNASKITAGILKDSGGNFSLDLSTGKVAAKKMSITSNNFWLKEGGELTNFDSSHQNFARISGAKIYFGLVSRSWDSGSYDNREYNDNYIASGGINGSQSGGKLNVSTEINTWWLHLNTDGMSVRNARNSGVYYEGGSGTVSVGGMTLTFKNGLMVTALS